MKRDELIKILDTFQREGDFDTAVKQIEELYLERKGRGLSFMEAFKKEVQPFVEDIYNAYPRREARPKAYDAIRKAIAKRMHEEDQTLIQAAEYILLQTEKYAEIRKGQDKKFTPMPATWYNQERFNDLDSDPQPQEQLFT